MAKRKEVAPPPDPRRTDTLTLPDGRLLEEGEEFTVKEEGRFAFHYGWHGTEATCWGPVQSKTPMWRTFRASAISTIHRKTTRKTTP